MNFTHDYFAHQWDAYRESFERSYFVHLWNAYLENFKTADRRVADWPLMWAYWPTWILTLSYLLVVYYGPKLMRNKKPLKNRWPLFAYNMILVLMNSHIVFEIVCATYRREYKLACQPVSYSYEPDEMRIAGAIWWYYFSKCVEFFDTVFFILRKKERQITFLHVYHHATMFPLWWIGTKWVAGGQSAFGAATNSFIHVLMYTYYGISSLGPAFQKFLWWKKYMTKLQLAQFLAGVTHSAHALYFECDFPRWMLWAVMIYGISILVLFLNFYFQAYVKPEKEKAKHEQIKESSEGSDHEVHCCDGKTSEEQAMTRIKSSQLKED